VSIAGPAQGANGVAAGAEPQAVADHAGHGTQARRSHLDTLAVSLLLACCLFWGFQQVLVKATVPEVAPVFQAVLRFVGASALILLWSWWRNIELFQRDGSLQGGLLAGALFAGEFACLYIGLQFTSASQLTVFLYTAPFWVAALLPIFVKSEHMTRLQWFGMLCAFGAIAFTFREGFGASQPLVWWGNLLALAGGMFWGMTTVVIRSSNLARVSAEKLLLYQVGISALILPLLSFGLGERWSFDFSAFALLSLGLQTVVGAFASFLVWMWMLGRYPATRLSAFAFLTPISAVFFGNLWLREPVTVNLVAALALVAVGIALVNRKPDVDSKTDAPA
jgi:drug/metabolite transporter (DMT)-like permease